MTVQTWSVEGMTCGHCEKSVIEKLMLLPGVERVSVALTPNGVSTITTESSSELNAQEFQDSLSDAGSYSLI